MVVVLKERGADVVSPRTVEVVVSVTVLVEAGSVMVVVLEGMDAGVNSLRTVDVVVSVTVFVDAGSVMVNVLFVFGATLEVTMIVSIRCV
jgi:hypothetical protein